MKFVPRECIWCGVEYAPRSARQRRCDPCRTRPAAELGRCDCGSLISGRGLWGATWGGECDRAEQRVHALMDSLAARAAS